MSWLHATLDYAPALIFAAQGGVLSERAGVVALELEGMMRWGAFCAAVAALVLPTPWAIALALFAGAALGALYALLCIRLKADGVIAGLAFNAIALAGAAFLLESFFSAADTPPITPLHRLHWPAVEAIPLLSDLSGHSPLTYLALTLPLAMHLLLHRTAFGLRLRATGDAPEAVTAAGVSVPRLRWAAVIGCGALAALGGATLSVAILDRFEHHMPSGLGFMALAATLFGRWRPLGAWGAALFFAGAHALRVSLSGTELPLLREIPQGIWLALPYLLTLILLVVRKGGAATPAALGRAA